ncbi:MAG: hypothetical protein AVDCRST_MAG93-5592 [uncultured Chloroflexia bacterium]|uniref:Uncharacterized protein n=1 Tax=uncultured Chloroflexia bacterium TaxID=1672391 RepID=A0A6J4KXM5_9CHLR|nr:MAG: hypothetical protein AVDCRST_MAG93-5592 [uncultured Chloroflexia bacterium]
MRRRGEQTIAVDCPIASLVGSIWIAALGRSSDQASQCFRHDPSQYVGP